MWTNVTKNSFILNLEKSVVNESCSGRDGINGRIFNYPSHHNGLKKAYQPLYIKAVAYRL